METFEKNINYKFQNKGLLVKALTHPSALPPGQGLDFERLEFLGDRVLGLVIATWIFQKFPREKEGDLAKRFANLVRKETLLKVAAEINLSRFLTTKQEKNSVQKKCLETLLADGCEALIGALYLDGGVDVARLFIHQFWEETLQEDTDPPRDPKSTLQEWAQGLGKPHPQYVLLKESGPAHAPRFVVEVRIEGVKTVQGEGSSKKLAEKDAAQHLLKAISSL